MIKASESWHTGCYNITPVSFYYSEARISKDPIVGLMQRAAADDSPDKLLAIVGAALDDDGKLLVPEVIKETSKELSANGLDMNYAPSSGIPGLAPLLSEEILGKKTCSILESKRIHRAELISSGGTNAISSTLMALAGPGDIVLTHNPHWAGYDSVSLALEREAVMQFDILDEAGDFNIQSFKDSVAFACKNKPEGKLILILNTPFDNPLGKDFGEAAWENIAQALYRQRLSDIDQGLAEREIVVIIDTAYVDFGPGGKDYSRLSFLPKFFLTVNGPDVDRTKFSVVIAGTVSKSFAMYGARVGVATLLTASTENSTQWKDSVGGVIRGTFSNASKPGQDIAKNILEDMSKLAQIHEFHSEVSELISKRNQFFIDAIGAEKSNAKILKIEKAPELELIKSDGGFFTSLRIKNKDFAQELANRCLEKHFYIPLISQQFLRIPTCGLNEKKLELVANKITEFANEICLR